MHYSHKVSQVTLDLYAFTWCKGLFLYFYKHVLCTAHQPQLQCLTLLSKTFSFLVGWLVGFNTAQINNNGKRPSELQHKFVSPYQIFMLVSREKPLLWLLQSRLQLHPMSKEEPP